MLDAAQDAAVSHRGDDGRRDRAAAARDRRPRARPRLPDRRDLAPLNRVAATAGESSDGLQTDQTRCSEIQSLEPMAAMVGGGRLRRRALQIKARRCSSVSSMTSRLRPAPRLRQTSLAAMAAVCAVHHHRLSLRRRLCRRAEPLRAGRGLPCGRGHLLRRHADCRRHLSGAQAADRGARGGAGQGRGAAACSPILRCWRPASRSCAGRRQAAGADPRHRRAGAWPDGKPRPSRGRSGARRIIQFQMFR